jgi:hypothetical protein
VSDDPDSNTSALDDVLDMLVFAPLGAFLHGPETVDDLASKGRQDVANARFLGRAALERGLGGSQDQIGSLFESMVRCGVGVVKAGARAAGVPFDDSEEPTVGSEARSDEAAEESRLRVVVDETDVRAESSGPDVDTLAIPGYDTLAASQVVRRLDDLADDELAAVQDYERAHRGRMTILSRIAQLRAS